LSLKAAIRFTRTSVKNYATSSGGTFKIAFTYANVIFYPY
jgi:hypothetical protein